MKNKPPGCILFNFSHFSPRKQDLRGSLAFAGHKQTSILFQKTLPISLAQLGFPQVKPPITVAGFTASAAAPPALRGDGGRRKDLQDLILPFFPLSRFLTLRFWENGQKSRSALHGGAPKCKALHPFAKPAQFFCQRANQRVCCI